MSNRTNNLKVCFKIDDYNGNGYYDIKDFIEAPNEKILEINEGMKFDICLMNPPYSTGNDGLHLKFTSKCLNLCETVLCLMPFSFISVKSNTNAKYIKEFDKFLKCVDEIDSDIFSDTHMANVGIYNFNANKKSEDRITIKYIANTIEVNSLEDISEFSPYENVIKNYLQNNGSNLCISTPYYQKNDYDSAIKAIKKFPKDKAILVCSSVNGKLDAKFMSNKIGIIFEKPDEDFIEFLMKSKSLTPYNYLIFNNALAAKNCKIALNNNLLRFFLAKTQDNQRMPKSKCYKYVPDIDWSDPRVVTDEGLLEVCGCPKDKCKEYAEYCKNYMEEFDKNKHKK